MTWRDGNDYVVVGRNDVLQAPLFGALKRELSSPHPRRQAGARDLRWKTARNFLITIALSVLILTVWQTVLHESAHGSREGPRGSTLSRTRAASGSAGEAAPILPQPGDPSQPGAPAVPGAGTALPVRLPGATTRSAPASAFGSTRRALSGSINLVGARIDDLVLTTIA